MTTISQLLQNNQRWVAEKASRDPAYFTKRVAGFAPKYLFIGCSDLGVAANELLGLKPGEVLTHSNVANLVAHSDMSLLSVLQHAVQNTDIEDIIVCGSYDCAGVAAAASHQQNGLLDSWLTQVRDVVRLHEKELLRIGDDTARLRRLVELNVMEQVRNLAKTSLFQNAIQAGRTLRLHGLVYEAATGQLNNLNVDAISGWAEIYATHPAAAAPRLTVSRGTRPLVADRAASGSLNGHRRRSA
ncbi:carbonic anhydrase [Hymenobacter artigasi]|uniref:carbonic anhydrase n=1 Tax=Hymenobacter artigasi TaxID=2719616 RepID=A0ABX1HHJ1_9BACT|nr:carbonic anhydrase [Hymenobacter artigasi]NKI89682.1 carbonic anhydrase [Hymenobacter artigasi]